MYEKTRRTKTVGVVDKKKLQWLRETQKRRNVELNNSNLFCNLCPNISKGACKDCPYFKECKHLEWEREYVLKEASKKTNQRRKRKQDNSKRNTDFFQEISDEEESVDEDNEEIFDYPDWNETCWW